MTTTTKSPNTENAICCALSKSTGIRCKNKATIKDSKKTLRWCALHYECSGSKAVLEYHSLCDIFFNPEKEIGEYWVYYLYIDHYDEAKTIRDFDFMKRQGVNLPYFNEKMRLCVKARKANTTKCWHGCSDKVHEKFVNVLEKQSKRLSAYIKKM